MIPPLLTEADVAVRLNCTPHQVRRLPIRGVYLDTKRKRKKRYTEDDIERYLRGIGVKPCRSSSAKTANRRSTITSSKLTGGLFAAALNALPSAKPSRMKELNASADARKLLLT